MLVLIVQQMQTLCCVGIFNNLFCFLILKGNNMQKNNWDWNWNWDWWCCVK